MALGNFAGGFAEAFFAAKRQKQELQQREEERKLRTKLFELELRKAEMAQEQINRQQGAREQLSSLMAGQTPLQAAPGTILDPRGPMSLTDALADPEGFRAAMESGMFTGKDLLTFQREQRTQELLQNALGGGGLISEAGAMGGAGPGLELSAVKLDPAGRPMLDFSRREVVREVPSPDGLMMLQMDRQGRVVSSRPIGPAERQIRPQTPGQTALDTAFGKEAADFVAAGGFADVQKGLSQLEESIQELKKEGDLTGPARGSLPAFARLVLTPKSVAIQEQVEEVVQRNLRLVLGAQFTEREGERLIARAYNPRLNDEENAKRLQRLIGQIRTAAQAKQEAVEYFSRHGTLEGFKGKIWEMADFMRGLDEEEPAGSVIDFNDLPE